MVGEESNELMKKKNIVPAGERAKGWKLHLFLAQENVGVFENQFHEGQDLAFIGESSEDLAQVPKTWHYIPTTGKNAWKCRQIKA